MHHFVSEDTQRPPVSAFIISTSFQHFRGQILGSTTKGFSSLTVSDDLCHSEVCQVYVSIIVHQNILEFEVSIDEVLGVEVSESQSYLHGIELGLFFWELFLVGEVLEEFSSL